MKEDFWADITAFGFPPKCTAYVKARTVGLYRGRPWLGPGFRFLLLIGCTHIYVTVKPDNRKKAKGKRKGEEKATLCVAEEAEGPIGQAICS